MFVAERSAQKPLYEEVVQNYAFRGKIFITTILLLAIIHQLREHPSEKILFVPLAVIGSMGFCVVASQVYRGRRG